MGIEGWASLPLERDGKMKSLLVHLRFYRSRMVIGWNFLWTYVPPCDQLINLASLSPILALSYISINGLTMEPGMSVNLAIKPY